MREFINEKEIRHYISEDLDRRINAVIEKRLDDWFHQNIDGLVTEALKKAFSKMLVVKFGE